jgi:hypothetical protein
VSALLTALLAYLVVRAAIRHILTRDIWTGSKEMKEIECGEREVKEKYLSSLEQYAPGDNMMLNREMTNGKGPAFERQTKGWMAKDHGGGAMDLAILAVVSISAVCGHCK